MQVYDRPKMYRNRWYVMVKIHSRKRGCPNCGNTGKIRWCKAYVYFVCSCGLNISAPDFETLKRKLKDVVVAKQQAQCYGGQY